jgi:topoisomerase-4 subunit A
MYDLTNGTKGSQILYFTCNKREAEVITVLLRQVGTIKLKFDIDFASLAIKGRASKEFGFKIPNKRKLK